LARADDPGRAHRRDRLHALRVRVKSEFLCHPAIPSDSSLVDEVHGFVPHVTLGYTPEATGVASATWPSMFTTRVSTSPRRLGGAHVCSARTWERAVLACSCGCWRLPMWHSRRAENGGRPTADGRRNGSRAPYTWYGEHVLSRLFMRLGAGLVAHW
jgi:hypothetical protein